MAFGFEREVFARRMKAIREERGMDQDDLAKASGVSKSAIAYYESTRSTPKADAVVAIANALDCSVDVLIGRVPLIDSIAD